jgi:hypothetical protein
MDTSKLRKFATFARSSLIEQVGTRLKTVLAEKSLARRESPIAVKELESKIKDLGEKRVVERVAYTWFNRFCALRYMDVNRYTRIGVLSPAEGQFQPEILAEAKMGHIDEELVSEVTRRQVMRLLDGSEKSADPQGEAYRLLLVAVCNYYYSLMPFMFERIADYTELLLPDDLLSGTSIPAYTREVLLPINCSPEHTEESVEVIGWLYQFYIADKKDEIFDGLKKGKKIIPENIPAATQLFTPHWIVRYLVENSLGRLWMLNHPDSKLSERMDYYIKPEEPEADFLKISSPEEIKVCDPACGSGHMLTYAFDLLYEIYREEQYPEPEIPSLILKNNLYGIEIDHRAGALAAFALTMKAREKDKRFFNRKSKPDASARDFSSIDKPKSEVQNPNICVLENISIDPEDLSAYMDKVGRDLFSGGLQGVVNQWQEADNFGSLIRPMVTDVSEELELLRERKVDEDLFLSDVHQKVLKALRQANYLSPKYHVVVANPPYTGFKNMNPSLKAFADTNYENSSSDLYAMFIERLIDIAPSGQLVSMVTMDSWMYGDEYNEFRESLLSRNHLLSLLHLGPRAFDEISGEVVQVAAFVIKTNLDSLANGVFIDLVGYPNSTEKRVAFTEGRHRVRRSTDWFEVFPRKVLVGYRATNHTREAFVTGKPLQGYAEAFTGLQTGDNPLFIKYWYEPSMSAIAFGCDSRDDAKATGKKWFPYIKGSEYRKWYGNQFAVVDWKNDGQQIREHRSSTVRNSNFYFRKGLAYNNIAKDFCARYVENGFIFDQKNSMFFPETDRDLLFTLGFLHSTVIKPFLKILSPKDFNPGSLKVIPVRQEAADAFTPSGTISRLIELTRNDWNRSEISWDFRAHVFADQQDKEKLEERYRVLSESWLSECREVLELEQKNDDFFISKYQLQDDIESSVRLEAVTLFVNPSYRYGSDKSESELESLLLADTMREFISYAVGCMLGRYSLDKPGLILANQGETADDYLRQIPEPTFAPDEDNVIPLLDGDWFEDDITERFKAFLKVTFGTEHYDENLKFLEDALYPDNAGSKKRKTIRDYFLKDFYNHHIKLYKKRPIYWLFSSPKGTFSALIYMHRYRPDTVGTVLHYLRDFRDKLTHHADHQQMLADSASASKSEKTQAIKDVAAIKKQLKELEDYEKTLFEVAARKIDIDLDDGVKHNYQLFGSVLRKIPGLDAKGDE